MKQMRWKFFTRILITFGIELRKGTLHKKYIISFILVQSGVTEFYTNEQ